MEWRGWEVTTSLRHHWASPHREHLNPWPTLTLPFHHHHHGRLGPRRVRDMAAAQRLHCQAGNAAARWGNGSRTKKGKSGFTDSGLVGLESFIMKSPVTRPQRAPYRPAAANKTTRLHHSGPLLTSFEREWIVWDSVTLRKHSPLRGKGKVGCRLVGLQFASHLDWTSTGERALQKKDTHKKNPRPNLSCFHTCLNRLS